MNEHIDHYLRSHYQRHLDELSAFLRIPSISALSEHKPDMKQAAEWLAGQLRQAGAENVAIYQTAGNPVVYGDYAHRPGQPTVLVYGHYDVQPVDPLTLWETAPFEPSIRDGKLYARGASDDKGQVFMHIKSLEAILASGEQLSVNLKFCMEGEEEIGSPHLPEFVETHRELLAADVLLVSDTTMFGPDQPAICYGLRGLCALQVDIRAAKSDLHSGLFGGAVPNALHAMVELLATMHSPDGSVAVAGFYDDVQPLGAEERSALSALPHDDDAYRTALGLTALHGEPGYSTSERYMARPTLEINGLYGGFQGEGTKTVIPAAAHAKITCRLVNNQTPDRILDLITEHIQSHTPVGVTVNVQRYDSGLPFVTHLNSPAIATAAASYEAGFGVAPYYTRMGGSIPIVEVFDRLLHTPVVLMGFGLPDENFHAPNEHFSLANFERGLRTIAHFYTHLQTI